METTKTLEVSNSNKEAKTSKLRNVLLAWVLAATLLTWCWNWKSNEDKNTDQQQFNTEFVETKDVQNDLFTDAERSSFELIEHDSEQWTYIYENPKTKQRVLVLGHPKKKPTLEWGPDDEPDTKVSDEMDDINNVTRIWNTAYYIWINWWKKCLYKNKEKIFEWNIKDYRVLNDTVISVEENDWKEIVRWWEKVICDDCTWVQFLDDWIVVTKWWKSELYIDGKLHLTVNAELKHPQRFSPWNWHYVLIDRDDWYNHAKIFIDGKLIASNVEVEYLGDPRGEFSIVKITKSNWKTIFIDARTNKKIWWEYDDIGRFRVWEDGRARIENIWLDNNNNLVICTEKNGKAVYVINWDDYEHLSDGEHWEMMLKHWNIFYFFDYTWLINIWEYDYDYALQIGKTSDWKIYFIWKKWDKEDFVIDWKVMWKSLDHISSAWLLLWWWVYVSWEKNWKKVFILNWTERWWEEYSDSDFQGKDSKLFSR